MQCQSCSAHKEKLFCPACVQTGINQQRTLKGQLSDQINVVTRRCAIQEQAASRWRMLRAEVATQEHCVLELQKRLQLCTAEISIKRSTSPSRSSPSPGVTQRPELSDLDKRIAEVQQRQSAVDRRIVSARRVLVTEAGVLMGLVDGEIAGLPLPTPGDIKLHKATLVNAALQHTCHLLDLLTRYLYIALPFEPGGVSDARKGRISIKPNLPFIPTTRYRDKNILWFGRKHTRTSYTAYALLAHSVAYLAWTQGVQEADIAANLNALVRSPNLGEKSHLGRMRSLGFSLDVNEVVSQVLEEGGVEEGTWAWALVDA